MSMAESVYDYYKDDYPYLHILSEEEKAERERIKGIIEDYLDEYNYEMYYRASRAGYQSILWSDEEWAEYKYNAEEKAQKQIIKKIDGSFHQVESFISRYGNAYTLMAYGALMVGVWWVVHAICRIIAGGLIANIISAVISIVALIFFLNLTIKTKNKDAEVLARNIYDEFILKKDIKEYLYEIDNHEFTDFYNHPYDHFREAEYYKNRK